jgi:hypothetical protein
MAKRANAAKTAASTVSSDGPASESPSLSLVRPARPRRASAGGRRAASVFVSYSRLDQLVCDQIVRELKDRGHAVWLDREAIHGGEVWRASIEKGIKAADVFVILLSPGVFANPDYTREELEFARKHRKTIVAAWLKAPQALPDGFELILSGRQFIELSDFDRGMRQLFEALGEPVAVEAAAPTSFWERTVRKVQRARAVVANSDLGPAAVKLGAAALAGAAAVMVAVATVNEEKRRASLRQYRATVGKILGECLLQLKLTEDMTPEEYAREFRPEFRRLLGQLEATTAPTDELAARHDKFVASLKHAVDNYDEAAAKLERGEGNSARRSMARFAAAFSETLHTYAAWLDDQT